MRTYNNGTVRKKDISKRTYRKPIEDNKTTKIVELKSKKVKAEKPEKKSKNDK